MILRSYSRMRRWWFNQCILSLTNYWSKEDWFLPALDYLHLVFDKYWHDTTDLFQDHWLQTWHSPSWQCWCKSPECNVWTPYIHWQSGWEAGFLNKNVIQKSSWNYTSNVLQWLSDIEDIWWEITAWIDKCPPIQHWLQFEKQVWPVSNLKLMGELLVYPSNSFYV